MQTDERQILLGLSAAEVEESRNKYGVNVLTPPVREPLWKKFLYKFRDPLIVILLIAGILSIGISFYEYFSLHEPKSVFFEPIGILVAILLATGIAFLFEVRADRAFSLLNQVSDEDPVKVIRYEGKRCTVPRRDIVVGDIVVLQQGDEVPADATLIRATQLHVDESTLTGEPICSKTVVESEFDADATFPSNHVLRGTKVMEGHALCQVFAVGDQTENGKVFDAAQIDTKTRTPLNEQLDRLGKYITWGSYLIGALIILGRVLMYLGETSEIEFTHFAAYVLQSVMLAVTLVVVAVPEGLPMAVALSLAYSMRRMLKTNNLVRKMHACETMGATTVICTDKTGTLTQNKMTVWDMHLFASDTASPEVQSLLQAGVVLNSTAMLDRRDSRNLQVVGNPTEGALLLYLAQSGIDEISLRRETQVLEELPFDTERKFMATVVRTPLLDNRRVLLVKGAPEVVRHLCSATHDGITSSEDIDKLLADYQQRAMRTLAFAYKFLDDAGTPCFANGRMLTDGLTLLAVTAISDPVRLDVADAIADCRNAGIQVKIITGDTPGTARQIAREVGLWHDAEDGDRNIVTGAELAAMSDEELRRRAPEIKIIARARPMDKKRMVEALQALNEVVVVTGDGTNDAPALKVAHVGLAMGDGTAVAKEAGDITIIDNSFTSIGRAVMWGRSLYRNIQRFILFQLTVNVAACLIVLFGAFMGVDAPLTVTQMLWVNLIMDTFAAMALASLPPSNSVMNDPPRPRKAFIISRAMARRILAVGGIMFVVLLWMLHVLEHADIHSVGEIFTCKLGSHDHLSPYELSLFFTFFVMLQFWNMFNARAFMTAQSAFRLKDCRGFLFIASIVFVGQIFIVNFGGQLFNVVPLDLADWLLILVITMPVLLVGELFRLLRGSMRHSTKG